MSDDVGVTGTSVAQRGSQERQAAPAVIPRRTLLAGVMAGVLALDMITKLVVQRVMEPYRPIEIFGDFVRLTFVHNPGAAFGIYFGPYSRGIFLALSLVALAVLAAMYANTPVRAQGRLTAIALIAAGALGNLIDRLRSTRGVIDFIDVGVGALRWPVFNVADMAVTAGAILLALTLWREDGSRRGARH
ncbi:MAG: signal peptidase II [Gemmatimonadetes bacterium]|nr:signal peptidase II [Gemmatimonadota bacterium]